MVSDQAGWQDQARRLVSLLMDGLRYGATGNAGRAVGQLQTLWLTAVPT